MAKEKFHKKSNFLLSPMDWILLCKNSTEGVPFFYPQTSELDLAIMCSKSWKIKIHLVLCNMLNIILLFLKWENFVTLAFNCAWFMHIVLILYQ